MVQRRQGLVGCGLLLVAAGWLLAGRAGAQEVQWRTDYAKARQEAAEKERPIIIDIGTEQCFWCKQLDSRTFKDAGVLAILNEQCIPLRVDANRNPQLVQALRVQNYPTIVFAGSDGKILGYQEGFVEAPQMREYLQRTVAAVTPPPWMLADLKEATRLAQTGDNARAIGLLKSILEDGKDRPVQVRARGALEDIEKQASAKLAQAKQLADRGQQNEAIAAANEVTKSFPGSVSAREASAFLTSLTKPPASPNAERARQLLAQAKEDFRTQQFGCCLDRCELLASQFADQPEGEEARRLLNDIKSNPEWMRQACEQMNERMGVMYLALADNLILKGQPQQARAYLDRVLLTLPNTKHAESAQAKLAQIANPGPASGLPQKNPGDK